MSGNPLANLGDLTKPASVLIEKISDAIGGIFKPYQMVRVARAEAETEQIRAESQIQITDLHRRAMHRFLEEEARKQSNIEEITRKALPFLAETSSPQSVEDDWITNFFDKSRIISDNDMQKLWSKVLAGEANSPGTFSKRTVNLLADLDKSDAELFIRLCAFVWTIDDLRCPLVFDHKHHIYNHSGIHFDALYHLESLGLIQFVSVGFVKDGIAKNCPVSYYGRSMRLNFSRLENNQLDIGQVLLTRAGRDLSGVCNSGPVNGFFDYVHTKWLRPPLVTIDIEPIA